MIKLEKIGNNWEGWNVHVDGEIFSLAEYGSKWSERTYQFPSDGDLSLSIKNLLSCNFCDFPPELFLIINNDEGILGKQIKSIYLCTDSESDDRYFGYCWDIQLDNWQGHFNPFLIRNEVARMLESQAEFPINKKIDLSDESGYASIYFDVYIDQVENFGEFCVRFSSFLDKAFDEVEERLSVGGFSNKIVAKFSFDEEVQQTCISYLNYFIDFLRDLGVKSKSQVNFSGQDILFSIIPDSKEESLSRISQALSFYLKLPGINTDNFINEYLDPLVELKLERLKSEIDRLKGDLRTREALMRYQDKLLSNGAVKLREPVDALQCIYVDGKEENKEEFLSGGIKLGVFKKYGIEFDWSALLGHFKPK